LFQVVSTESGTPSPVHRKPPEIPLKSSSHLHHYQQHTTTAAHASSAADHAVPAASAAVHPHAAPATTHIYHPLNPPFQGLLLKNSKVGYSSLWESHCRAMERHLPCVITQYYLPLDTGESTPF